MIELAHNNTISEFNHHSPTLLWFVSYYCERVQSSLSHAIMVCIVLLWATSIITLPRYYGLYRIILSEFNHHSPTLLWFVSYYCERVQSSLSHAIMVCIVLLWASSIITLPRYYGLYRIIVSEFNHHSPTLLWFVSYYCERVQSSLSHAIMVCIVLLWASSIITFPRYYGLYRIIVSEFNHHSPTLLWFVSYYCELVQSSLSHAIMICIVLLWASSIITLPRYYGLYRIIVSEFNHHSPTLLWFVSYYCERVQSSLSHAIMVCIVLLWASSIITFPRYYGLYRIIVSEFNHHSPTLLWFVSYYCERVQSSLSHAIMVCIVLLWASSIITLPRYYGLYRIIVSEFNHHSPTLLWFVSYYCERVQSSLSHAIMVCIVLLWASSIITLPAWESDDWTSSQ